MLLFLYCHGQYTCSYEMGIQPQMQYMLWSRHLIWTTVAATNSHTFNFCCRSKLHSIKLIYTVRHCLIIFQCCKNNLPMSNLIQLPCFGISNGFLEIGLFKYHNSLPNDSSAQVSSHKIKCLLLFSPKQI